MNGKYLVEECLIFSEFSKLDEYFII